jgi:hypothetical protein
MKKPLYQIMLGCLVCMSLQVHSADINQQVANAYNDGIVRCTNAECARYLYACFRSFSSGSLNEFLACGTQASRLNDNQFVVSGASDQTAQK